MKNLHEKKEEMLNSIRGIGPDIEFSKEEIEKSRKENLKKFEEIEREENFKRCKAWEEAKHIYITF